MARENSSTSRLFRLFSGHPGAHGTHGQPVQEGMKWGIKSTARTMREPPTVKHWEEHLAGERPLGIIPIREDSTCLWGSIDVDDYDVDVKEVIGRIAAKKLPLVPCRSKSGGLHLFLFMSEPAPAANLQAALRDAAARLGLAGSEIFPKQKQVLSAQGDVGNWMVMPYFGSTYEGKIKSQVGLKSTGTGDLSVDEFLDVAEASKIGVDQLASMVSGRPRSVQAPPSSKRGGRAAAAPSTNKGEPFADGPPCLQHLAEVGVVSGGQSNTLLMMGAYFKRAFPGEWKKKLQEANHLFLTPPGSAEGLAAVIKSLDRKDYEYTCKAEPMASYCNSAVCRTRQFGVGSGGGYPVITGLTKLLSDPPLWFVDIGDGRVQVTTEELLVYQKFQLVCMARLSQVYSSMKQSDWVQALAAAMVMMEPVDAPPNLSRSGQFLELLEEFLTNRSRGQRREDLREGRPWENEEERRHYFRMQDLDTFMQKNKFKVTRAEMRSFIIDLGGETFDFNIKRQHVRGWWVPSDAIQAAPELDATPEREEPI